MLQGEREMAADNKVLADSCWTALRQLHAVFLEIEVTFNLDANGILNVTAKDKGTGKEQSITIQNSGNLSKEDVEKGSKRSKFTPKKTRKKREAIDARNTLEKRDLPNRKAKATMATNLATTTRKRRSKKPLPKLKAK